MREFTEGSSAAVSCLKILLKSEGKNEKEEESESMYEQLKAETATKGWGGMFIS